MNIKCLDVTKIYNPNTDRIVAVDCCNFEFVEGTINVVLGVSGSGKTTFLKLLGLLDTPTSGKILFDDKDLTLLSQTEKDQMRNKTIGFVYQNYNLIPLLTVEENILLPRYIGSKKYLKEELISLTTLLGIHQKLQHFPSDLSGGQQQRVAIARALINSPKLVLADEPTANLDYKTKQDVIKLFQKIHNEFSSTIIIATHDEAFIEIADNVFHIENGCLTNAK